MLPNPNESTSAWNPDDPYGFQQIRESFFPAYGARKLTKEDRKKYEEFKDHVARIVEANHVSIGAGRELQKAR